MIELKNVSHKFENGVHALNGVHFHLKEGERVGLMGLSGSGKSTLLRVLNLLVRPSQGDVIYRNKIVTQLSGTELHAYRSRLGMIFQDFHLIPRATVLSNVCTGGLRSLSLFQSTRAALMGKYPAHLEDQAHQVLLRLGLEDKANTRADRLSGGQQQRVALARCLLQNAEVLLADEPVASLDPHHAQEVMRLLLKANQEMGKTWVCNLHQPELLKQYCTRVIALKNGTLFWEGKPHELNDSLLEKVYGR